MGLRHRHAKVHRGAFEEDGGGAVVVINPLVGRETLQQLSHFCRLLGRDQSDIGGRMPGIVVELAPRQHGNKEPQNRLKQASVFNRVSSVCALVKRKL